MITRREFLKWMGVGALASQVPAEVIDALIKQHDFPEWKNFKSDHEYGRGVPYLKSHNNAIITFLTEHTKKYIPPKYRKSLQIRRVGCGEYFGRFQTIAWFYQPNLKTGYFGKNGKWIYSAEDGLYIWSKI